MNRTDDQKWKIFWQESRRKLFRSLFVMTPIITLMVLAFNASHIDSSESFWMNFRTAILYSYSISTMINLVTTVMWAAITLRGLKAIMAMKGVLWPHFLTSTLGLVLGLKLANLIEVRFLDGEALLPEQFQRDLVMGGMISLSMIFMFAYFETKKAAKQLARANEEANFNALKAQMHPHFLFNSLNSLSALIESDPARAEKMSQRLSDLYRTILAASQKNTISLREELEVVKAYLEIEKSRFDERLNYAIVVAEGEWDQQVPALMLQTLVENAVKHGVSLSINGGNITITIGRFEGKMKIEVVNSGASLKLKYVEGTGLQNTRSRLQLLFGEHADFSLSSRPDGQTVSRIIF